MRCAEQVFPDTGKATARGSEGCGKRTRAALFSLDSDSPTVEGIEHLIDSILVLKAEIRKREEDLVNREKDRNEFWALESFRGIGGCLRRISLLRPETCHGFRSRRS